MNERQKKNLGENNVKYKDKKDRSINRFYRNINMNKFDVLFV
jgi:hypothetical protein